MTAPFPESGLVVTCGSAHHTLRFLERVGFVWNDDYDYIIIILVLRAQAERLPIS